MTRNLYTEDPKNSIQLNAIYEMVSKISFDLVKNYEKPEEDAWSDDYWGISVSYTHLTLPTSHCV